MAVARRKGLTYEPRTLVDTPEAFGKVAKRLEPAAKIKETDARFRAAQLQHLLANKLREYLKTNKRDVAWFASKEAGHPGLSVDRMRRMLRGETMMQLADVMLITSLDEEAAEIVARNSGINLVSRKELRQENEDMRTVLQMCKCDARFHMPVKWQQEQRQRRQAAY